MSVKKRCGVLKAQLAASIIIGILMLAMGGTIYYLITSVKKTEAEKALLRKN